MKSKPTSVWKRYQFCGSIEIFGTQCYIDEITEIVHCNCTKDNNIKGFDWTIIYYIFQMAYQEKFHLVDRYRKDKSNRPSWHDLSTNFNSGYVISCLNIECNSIVFLIIFIYIIRIQSCISWLEDR